MSAAACLVHGGDGAASASLRWRAAVPADLDRLNRFVGALSLTSRVQRFFVPLRALPTELARALQQGDRAHRFVVAESGAEIVALGQYYIEPDARRCEMALVVADDWQRRGLGSELMARLLEQATAAGLREAVVVMLAANRGMRALARCFGFALAIDAGDHELLRGVRALGSR